MTTPAQQLFINLLQKKPRTFKAAQHIVMAAADSISSHGKRTLLGADKGLAAEQKLLRLIDALPDAMRADGLIDHTATFEYFLTEAGTFFESFEQAYPNWPEAYLLIHHILGEFKSRDSLESSNSSLNNELERTMEIGEIEERIAGHIAGVLDHLAGEGLEVINKESHLIVMMDNWGAGVMPRLQACLLGDDVVAAIPIDDTLKATLRVASAIPPIMRAPIIDKSARLAAQNIVAVLDGRAADARVGLTTEEIQAGIDTLMLEWEGDDSDMVLEDFLTARDELVELRGVLKAVERGKATLTTR
ncbi:hypothetical protein [Thermomonas sp.]|uniref:hypothetical protein n=1 Tax=Thermomonas sp. TaxID=1971895 RepID=UPI0035ADF754